VWQGGTNKHRGSSLPTYLLAWGQGKRGHRTQVTLSKDQSAMLVGRERHQWCSDLQKKMDELKRLRRAMDRRDLSLSGSETSFIQDCSITRLADIIVLVLEIGINFLVFVMNSVKAQLALLGEKAEFLKGGVIKVGHFWPYSCSHFCYSECHALDKLLATSRHLA
jgi:hypothetical protein